MDSLYKAIGAAAMFVGILAFAAITNGWALAILWGWFIVSLFHLPPLSLAAAIGLSLVIGFMTAQSTDDAERTWTEIMARALGFAIIRPLFAVGMGWVVHLWIG